MHKLLNPLIIAWSIVLASCDGSWQNSTKPEQQVRISNAMTQPLFFDKQVNYTREQVFAIIENFEGPNGKPIRSNDEWLNARNALDIAKEQGLNTKELEVKLMKALEKHVTKTIEDFEAGGNLNYYNEKWTSAQTGLDFAKTQWGIIDIDFLENRLKKAIEAHVIRLIENFEGPNGSLSPRDEEWLSARNGLEFAKDHWIDITELEARLLKAKDKKKEIESDRGFLKARTYGI